MIEGEAVGCKNSGGQKESGNLGEKPPAQSDGQHVADGTGGPLRHAAAPAVPEPDTERTCFVAGRRVWRVRGLIWLGCAVFCWLGVVAVDLAFTYGLRPADGGVLAPLPVRLAWAALVFLIGGGLAFGMLAYGRHYVARLDAGPGGVCVWTVGLFGAPLRRLARADIRGVRDHAGAMPGQPHGATPWRGIHVRGQRWPFVLDRQGQVLDGNLLAAALRRG